MKKIIKIILCFCTPILIFSQTNVDYSQIGIDLTSNTTCIEEIIEQNNFTSKISSTNNETTLINGLTNSFSDHFSESSFYAPQLSDSRKVIRLNLVILQNSQGEGNFQEGNPHDDEMLQGIISNLKIRTENMINGTDQCAQNSSDYFISDTMLEFDVQILYIRDDYAWDYTNSGVPSGALTASQFISSHTSVDGSLKSLYPPNSNFYLKDLSQSLYDDEFTGKAINVFFPTDGTVYNDMVVNGNYDNYISNGDSGSFVYSTLIGAGQYPSSNESEINRTSNIVIPNTYLSYLWTRDVRFNTDDFGYVFTSIADLELSESTKLGYAKYAVKLLGKQLLIHEIGHNLGLGHSHGSLPCVDHIMSYNSTAWNSGNKYFRGYEIDYIHKQISTTNLINHTHEDVHIDRPLIIETTDRTQNLSKVRIYNDIVVNSNSSLTVRSKEFIIPETASIYVDNGSSLIIENQDYNSTIKSVDENGVASIKILPGGKVIFKDGTKLINSISVTQATESELSNLLDDVANNNKKIKSDIKEIVSFENSDVITETDPIDIVVDKSKLKIISDIGNIKKLLIYDFNGKICFESSNNLKEYELSNLKKGVYYLSVLTNIELIQRKVLIN